MLNGSGLRPETLKEMLTPQIDMDKEKGLGWSLGFGTQTDANGFAIWQWGDYGIGGTYPDYRPLVPFSRDTFMLEGRPSFRLKFELDASGNPVKAVGLYEDGRRDETTRDK